MREKKWHIDERRRYTEGGREGKETHDEPVQSLAGALVAVDDADAALATGVEVKVPHRLVVVLFYERHGEY